MSLLETQSSNIGFHLSTNIGTLKDITLLLKLWCKGDSIGTKLAGPLKGSSHGVASSSPAPGRWRLQN